MSAPLTLTVAIDGPAASGKSSTARAVAKRLGAIHLDSGAFYRAATRVALDRGLDPRTWPGLDAGTIETWEIRARRTDAGFRVFSGEMDLTNRLRNPEVNARVSTMAAVPAVRAWLLAPLREFASTQSVVADGRDIGTVVFPDADLKVFLVCDPEERAARRLRDLGVDAPTLDELRGEAQRLMERDARDTEREAAPLLRAPDAVVLDTTALDFDAQVRFVVRLVEERRGE